MTLRDISCSRNYVVFKRHWMSVFFYLYHATFFALKKMYDWQVIHIHILDWLYKVYIYKWKEREGEVSVKNKRKCESVISFGIKSDQNRILFIYVLRNLKNNLTTIFRSYICNTLTRINFNQILIRNRFSFQILLRITILV